MSPNQGDYAPLMDMTFQDCGTNDKATEKSWIIYSILAATLIAACNTTMSDLSAIGLEGLLYLSPGNLLCGVTYWVVTRIKSTKGFSKMNEVRLLQSD